MEDILVTGATGTVGSAIARRLLARGRPVKALVRDVERGRSLLPEGVTLVQGDVTDFTSVRSAMKGVGTVYHAAGLPEQWRPDPADFWNVNVTGTRHIVKAATAAGVQTFVYTSTIDVFRWTRGKQFDESALDDSPKHTPYERSKQIADRIVTQAIEQGLPARLLHPSAVYGPAPVITPGTNHLLNELRHNRIPLLIPGGLPVVLADDVADGHIAAETSPVGSRFILSESYQSLTDVAHTVRRHSVTARVPRVLPRWIARVGAVAGEATARLTHRPPLIPSGQLHFLASHALPLADRAATELGWRPTPFDAGVEQTLAAFEDTAE
ncbi:MAG: NAD-dependent epimerase/dehydratase family protein [Thermocrispum sp.]